MQQQQQTSIWFTKINKNVTAISTSAGGGGILRITNNTTSSTSASSTTASSKRKRTGADAPHVDLTDEPQQPPIKKATKPMSLEERLKLPEFADLPALEPFPENEELLPLPPAPVFVPRVHPRLKLNNENTSNSTDEVQIISCTDLLPLKKEIDPESVSATERALALPWVRRITVTLKDIHRDDKMLTDEVSLTHTSNPWVFNKKTRKLQLTYVQPGAVITVNGIAGGELLLSTGTDHGPPTNPYRLADVAFQHVFDKYAGQKNDQQSETLLYRLTDIVKNPKNTYRNVAALTTVFKALEDLNRYMPVSVRELEYALSKFVAAGDRGFLLLIFSHRVTKKEQTICIRVL